MAKYSLYIGIVAGICTGIAMLPQLYKILKEKKAEQLSISMMIILLLGLGLWVFYGILKKDYPVIITNGFSFLINLLIIFFSVKYKKQL